MSEYDGSVKIDTEMDTDGFYADIKEMSDQVATLSKAIKDAKEQVQQVESAAKNLQNTDVSSGMKKVEEAAKNTGKAVEKVKEGTDAVGKNTAMSDDYVSVCETLDKVGSRLEQLSENQRGITAQFDSLNSVLEDTRKQLQQVESVVNNLQNTDVSAGMDGLESVISGIKADIKKVKADVATLETEHPGEPAIPGKPMRPEETSVWVNTEADKAGIYDGIKNMTSKTAALNNAIKEIQQQIQKVESEIEGLQNTDPSSGVRKLESAIKDTKSAIEKVKADMDTIDNAPVMTEDYKYMSDSLTKANAKFDQLLTKQEKMQALGKTNSASWKSLQYEIQQIEREIASTKAEMQDMRVNDEAFTVDFSALDKKQEELDRLNLKLSEYEQKLDEVRAKEAQSNADKLQTKQAQLDKLNGKLSVYNLKLQEAKKKENSMTAQTGKIKKLSASLSKLVHGAGAAGKGFSGIGGLLSSFTGRIGNLALSAMVFNAISQGLTKVRQELISCLQTDKQFSNSLAQIKGNLYTAFYPIYSYALPAINALMTGLERVTGSIAVFVSKLFGTTVGKSQASAKALRKQAQAISGIGDAAKKASGNLSDIDDMHILTDNKDTSGSGGGGTNTDSGISFGEVKTDPKVLEWLDKMKEKFQPLTEAIQRLIEAAKPLAGPFLMGLVDGLTDLITSDTAVGIINSLADALEKMDPEDAYAIGKAIGEIAAALGIIAAITGIGALVSSLGGLWEILLPMLTFVGGWQIGTGLYELITGESVDMTMWEELDEIFGTLFNDSGTFFDGLGWMSYDAIKGLTEDITGEALPSWGEFKEGVAKIWGESGIAGIITATSTGFLKLLGADSDTIKKVNEGAKLVHEKYSKAFGEGGIKGVFKQFGQDCLTVIRWMGTNIQTFFQNMINKIKGFFIGVGTSVGNTVRDAFAAAVNGIFSTIESRINGFIGAINAIRVLINKIPGVNLARVQTVSLPRLATGTVVPANYGEFQAILGDNKRAPEIVSPVPTMKQAVREVLNETGNSNKPIVIHNYVTLDGKVVYKTVVEYNNREIDMTGNSPLFA